MPTEVNLQGVWLAVRGWSTTSPLTLPFQGSNLMKGIKVTKQQGAIVLTANRKATQGKLSFIYLNVALQILTVGRKQS